MPGKLQLVCGEDSFLVRRKVRELAGEDAADGACAAGAEVVEPESAAAGDVVKAVWQAVELAQTMGLFVAGRMVLLRGADALFAARNQQPREVADTAESLAEWIGTSPLPDDHTLLWQVDKVSRVSRLYKVFAKSGEVFDFKVGTRPFELEKHALAQLEDFLRERKLLMSPELRRLFVGRVGTATWRLDSEVEKLDCYIMPRREVAQEDIIEATSMGSLDAAWDLTDAFGARDLDKAMVSLRRLLAQRQSIIGLTTQLENRVRDLLLFRQMLDRGWLRVPAGAGRRAAALDWEALPDAALPILDRLVNDPRKMNPFFAGRLLDQAKSYSLRELRNARHMLIVVRERIVSSGLPPEALLEISLCRIMGRSRRG